MYGLPSHFQSFVPLELRRETGGPGCLTKTLWTTRRCDPAVTERLTSLKSTKESLGYDQ
jgi:hypothetical protein